ncbi:MAG: ATP-binding protein, partial [Turicibacter sp.]
MRDLSLHVLDLSMNSIKAECTLIELVIEENTESNRLTIVIKDNGMGMDEKTKELVIDPFFTTRTTRKVGFGIPLYKVMLERCGGELIINSILTKGTELIGSLELNHIDRPPFGAIHETLTTLILMEPLVDYRYKHTVDDQTYIFDTSEIRA